jgi:hypothetical protein
MRSLFSHSRAFLVGAWRRLPIETALVSAAAVSLMAMVHDVEDVWLVRVFLATLVATPLAFALHGLGRRAEVAGGAAAFGLTLGALTYALPEIRDVERQAFLWPYGLALVAAVLVPFVVSARRFTGFVRRFFEEITTWSLLWGAASAAIAVVCVALDELFELPTKRLLGDLLLLETAAVVLLFLDRLLPDQEATGRMPQLWRRLAAGIGAPFVAVMLVILVAYEASVIVRGELPKNVLSPLIMGAGFVGFLCTLILDAVAGERVGSIALEPAEAHPFLRGRSIRLARAFPAVLLALLPMAAWALFVRIDQYGLTPFRVVRASSLLCLGVLAFLGTWRLFRRQGALSWQVPAIVGAFAIVTGFGPLSATTLSVRSQSARLTRLLDEAGIQDRHIAGPRKDARPLPSEQAGEIVDAIATLSEIGGEGALAEVLGGDYGACAPGWSAAHMCLELLGVSQEAAFSWEHATLPSGGVGFPSPAGELEFVDLYDHPDSDFVFEGDHLSYKGVATGSLKTALERSRMRIPLTKEPVVFRTPNGAVIGHLLIQALESRRWSDGRVEVTRVTGVWIR